MTRASTFSARHPIRVYLVDGHEAVRQGLGDLLDAEPDIIMVGAADSIEQALAQVPVARPDVAVVGVRLADDIISCRDLRSVMPALSLLTLTSFDDDTAQLDAVLAGADGFVLRQIRGNPLAAAVRSAATGNTMLDRATAKRLLDGVAIGGGENRSPGISARERHLLVLIGDGLTDRQIGRRLFLAETTVRKQISRLLTSGILRPRISPSPLLLRPSVQLPESGRRASTKRAAAAGSSGSGHVPKRHLPHQPGAAP